MQDLLKAAIERKKAALKDYIEAQKECLKIEFQAATGIPFDKPFEYEGKPHVADFIVECSDVRLARRLITAKGTPAKSFSVLLYFHLKHCKPLPDAPPTEQINLID